jgi:hypothetical protein
MTRREYVKLFFPTAILRGRNNGNGSNAAGIVYVVELFPRFKPARNVWHPSPSKAWRAAAKIIYQERIRRARGGPSGTGNGGIRVDTTRVKSHRSLA